MERSRGLSLLEIQVSLLLILLVCLYLISLFASGQRHARRSIDYSKCTLLAHYRLAEARAIPFKDLSLGLHQEKEPNTGFNTTLSLTSYEDGLYTLRVKAVAPSGAMAQAFTLVADPALKFHGIISDEFAHNIMWINGSNLMCWNDISRSSSNLGPTSDTRLNGALAGRPGSNFLWRGGQQESPLWYYETLPTPKTWSSALSAPVTAINNLQALPCFTGICCDWGTGQLIVADCINRGLWFSNNGHWMNSSVARANIPPLGRPAGLASDPSLGLIWVADTDYQCLRKFLSPTASAGYPASQIESCGSLGSWHRKQYRPPNSMGMGSPVGIAMDKQGWAVMVHDRARLYRWIEARDTWELWGEFPEDLRKELPSGMCSDTYGNVLFLTTERGSLWKIRPPKGLTPMNVTKLWP